MDKEGSKFKKLLTKLDLRRKSDIEIYLQEAARFRKRIDKLSLEVMMRKTKKDVLKYDPGFFAREDISTNDIAVRTLRLYPQQDDYQRALYKLKIWWEAIVYYFKINDQEELQHAIEMFKKVYSGDMEKRESEDKSRNTMNAIIRSLIPIPTIVKIEESDISKFGDFNTIKEMFSRTLPFLTNSEIQKITMKITSLKIESSDRAHLFKEESERYLAEVRELCENKDIPLPEYHKKTGAIIELIKRCRESILL